MSSKQVRYLGATSNAGWFVLYTSYDLNVIASLMLSGVLGFA
jgi:hypothetical protein